jgi:ArsR family transcriptional regulator, virulence genes transcriptional regulator
MKPVDNTLTTPRRTTVKKSPNKTSKRALKSPFNKVTYERNANVYKVLAHPVRLEILNILKFGERTVEELLSVVIITKPNMSQHLSQLRYAGVVATRKQGLNVVYRIVDPRIVEPCAIMRELRRDPR